MANIHGKYQGDLMVELCHEQSGVTLTSDAPLDNNGQGRCFSPTDLFVSSLGSCMMTLMGIRATSLEDSTDLSGARFDIVKTMGSNPRRVARIDVRFELPATLSLKHRQSLERAALACPVHASISKEVEINVNFEYV